MPDSNDYIVVVQCDIVMERCSGYFCEKAFNERSGGFASLEKGRFYRTLYLTCGGCCGRALHRKLAHLVRRLREKEQLDKSRIAVQMASCITRDNSHGPPCPHLAYLKTLVGKLGLDLREDTHLSATAERKRKTGEYLARCEPDQ